MGGSSVGARPAVAACAPPAAVVRRSILKQLLIEHGTTVG